MTEKIIVPRPNARMAEHRKRKMISARVSPLAYKKFMEIPYGERSMRVSKFLERIDPAKDAREPGERLTDTE